jgi:hypothetical protein
MAALLHRLFQRIVDRGELGVQLGTEPVHDGNDSERNTGCDEPVLNGGGAGCVRQECPKHLHCARHYHPGPLRQMNPTARIPRQLEPAGRAKMLIMSKARYSPPAHGQADKRVRDRSYGLIQVTKRFVESTHPAFRKVKAPYSVPEE